MNFSLFFSLSLLLLSFLLSLPSFPPFIFPFSPHVGKNRPQLHSTLADNLLHNLEPLVFWNIWNIFGTNRSNLEQIRALLSIKVEKPLKNLPISPTVRRHFYAPQSKSAIFLLIFTSSRTPKYRRFYANASRHPSSSLLSACSRRRARPKFPSQTTFISVAKFEVDGVLFLSFRRPSFTHFHPSRAPYAFSSIKTPRACKYQSIVSRVVC